MKRLLRKLRIGTKGYATDTHFDVFCYFDRNQVIPVESLVGLCTDEQLDAVIRRLRARCIPE